MKDDILIVQTSKNTIQINVNKPLQNESFQINISIKINIKGFDCSQNRIFIWSGN